MSDQIVITPKSESTDPLLEQRTAHFVRAQLVSLCALGLGVSFFLPWAQIFFAHPSGFDLQKDGHEQLLLWLIPFFCIVTIIAGFANASQHIAARITGILPFLVGLYWYSKIGNDLFHILAIGGYLSLFFGLLLLILPKRFN